MAKVLLALCESDNSKIETSGSGKRSSQFPLQGDQRAFDHYFHTFALRKTGHRLSLRGRRKTNTVNRFLESPTRKKFTKLCSSFLFCKSLYKSLNYEIIILIK